MENALYKYLFIIIYYVEENPGPTIFDIIDPTTTVSAGSSFVETNVCNRT